MTEVRRIAAITHGRYLVEEPADGAPRGVVVGFHGYGETADDHLEGLKRVPGADGWVLCAVQGLHPFYRGRSGEVVASWMTRLDREWAIEDNLRYVAAVVARIRRQFPAPLPLIFSGFSQGVAMAYRAAAGCSFPGDGLMALAGDVPPEVASRRPLGLPTVLLGRGTGDEWYTKEKMTADLAALGAAGVAVKECVFDGGHEWGEAFLAAAGGFLRETAASVGT